MACFNLQCLCTRFIAILDVWVLCFLREIDYLQRVHDINGIVQIMKIRWKRCSSSKLSTQLWQDKLDIVIRILFYSVFMFFARKSTKFSKWFPSYNNCVSFATTSNVAAIFCCVMGNGDDKNHELLHYSRKSLFIGA